MWTCTLNMHSTGLITDASTSTSASLAVVPRRPRHCFFSPHLTTTHDAGVLDENKMMIWPSLSVHSFDDHFGINRTFGYVPLDVRQMSRSQRFQISNFISIWSIMKKRKIRMGWELTCSLPTFCIKPYISPKHIRLQELAREYNHQQDFCLSRSPSTFLAFPHQNEEQKKPCHEMSKTARTLWIRDLAGFIKTLGRDEASFSVRLSCVQTRVEICRAQVKERSLSPSARVKMIFCCVFCPLGV